MAIILCLPYLNGKLNLGGGIIMYVSMHTLYTHYSEFIHCSNLSLDWWDNALGQGQDVGWDKPGLLREPIS